MLTRWGPRRGSRQNPTSAPASAPTARPRRRRPPVGGRRRGRRSRRPAAVARRSAAPRRRRRRTPSRCHNRPTLSTSSGSSTQRRTAPARRPPAPGETGAAGDDRLHVAPVVTVDLGRAQHQRELRGDAADRRDALFGDGAQGVVGPPAFEDVAADRQPQVPRRLGGDADVGELGGRQHRRTGLAGRRPRAARVGLCHRLELALAEHDGDGPVGLGGEDRPCAVPVHPSAAGSGQLVDLAGVGQHHRRVGEVDKRLLLGRGQPGLTPAVMAPTLA